MYKGVAPLHPAIPSTIGEGFLTYATDSSDRRKLSTCCMGQKFKAGTPEVRIMKLIIWLRWCNNNLEKYERQWEGLYHILWTILPVWKHQPVINTPIFGVDPYPNVWAGCDHVGVSENIWETSFFILETKGLPPKLFAESIKMSGGDHGPPQENMHEVCWKLQLVSQNGCSECSNRSSRPRFLWNCISRRANKFRGL